MGVVERIEYDPNRSSNIALIRWLHGIHPPRRHIAAATTPPRKFLKVEPSAVNNIRGVFTLNSMLPPVGTTASDVLFSAFTSKAKGGAVSEAKSLPLGLPRITVAAAKPTFFAARERGRKVAGSELEKE